MLEEPEELKELEDRRRRPLAFVGALLVLLELSLVFDFERRALESERRSLDLARRSLDRLLFPDVRSVAEESSLELSEGERPLERRTRLAYSAILVGVSEGAIDRR